MHYLLARRARSSARRGVRRAQRRRSRPAVPRRVPHAPRRSARADGDPPHADQRGRPQRSDRSGAHLGRRTRSARRSPCSTSARAPASISAATGTFSTTGPRARPARPTPRCAIECAVHRRAARRSHRGCRRSSRASGSTGRRSTSTDERDARWLLACIWPDTGRLERTSAAIREAQRQSTDHPPRRHGRRPPGRARRTSRRRDRVRDHHVGARLPAVGEGRRPIRRATRGCRLGRDRSCGSPAKGPASCRPSPSVPAPTTRRASSPSVLGASSTTATPTRDDARLRAPPRRDHRLARLTTHVGLFLLRRMLNAGGPKIATSATTAATT